MSIPFCNIHGLGTLNGSVGGQIIEQPTQYECGKGGRGGRSGSDVEHHQMRDKGCKTFGIPKCTECPFNFCVRHERLLGVDREANKSYANLNDDRKMRVK
jgi:hypothetical protein